MILTIWRNGSDVLLKRRLIGLLAGEAGTKRTGDNDEMISNISNLRSQCWYVLLSLTFCSNFQKEFANFIQQQEIWCKQWWFLFTGFHPNYIKFLSVTDLVWLLLLSDTWKGKTRKLTPRTSTTSNWVFQERGPPRKSCNLVWMSKSVHNFSNMIPASRRIASPLLRSDTGTLRL